MNRKERLYRTLVEDVRKDYLSRIPVKNSKGVYLTWAEDCHEINLWTYWQGLGSYDAKIMLVGQDWGYIDQTSRVLNNIREINQGLRTDYSFDETNPTDNHLSELFSVINYDLSQRCDDLFFTNFVLGYRSEGLSGNLMHVWIAEDAPYFSRLVNIIEPKVIICLGKDTFRNVQYACTGKMPRIGKYNSFIESSQNPVTLPLLSGKTVTSFAVAHCGTIGTMNRNRTAVNGMIKSSLDLNLQKEDWKRIKYYL